MNIDYGDVIATLGAAILFLGLYLIDWRFALVATGFLLLVIGVARVIIRSRKSV